MVTFKQWLANFKIAQPDIYEELNLKIHETNSKILCQTYDQRENLLIHLSTTFIPGMEISQVKNMLLSHLMNEELWQ